MRYYRVMEKFGDVHLCVETRDGVLTSLTSINDSVDEFIDLLKASRISGQGVDAIARRILKQDRGKKFKLSQLIDWSITGTGEARLMKPLEPGEMWAGGLGNSVMTTEELAKASEGIRLAYSRPEVSTAVYKGTNDRLVGPFDMVGIRADTERTVAEGEVVLVIYKGELAGYTTGNEVAGGLAGLLPGWSVPAKVFKGCASVGPCVVTPESIKDTTAFSLELVHSRGGKEVARSAAVARLRPPEAIVASTVAHDSPPDLAIQYTGGIVASGESPLEAGDVVRISMEGVGFVQNTVEVV